MSGAFGQIPQMGHWEWQSHFTRACTLPPGIRPPAGGRDAWQPRFAKAAAALGLVTPAVMIARAIAARWPTEPPLPIIADEAISNTLRKWGNPCIILAPALQIAQGLSEAIVQRWPDYRKLHQDQDEAVKAALDRAHRSEYSPRAVPADYSIIGAALAHWLMLSSAGCPWVPGEVMLEPQQWPWFYHAAALRLFLPNHDDDGLHKSTFYPLGECKELASRLLDGAALFSGPGGKYLVIYGDSAAAPDVHKFLAAAEEASNGKIGAIERLQRLEDEPRAAVQRTREVAVRALWPLGSKKSEIARAWEYLGVGAKDDSSGRLVGLTAQRAGLEKRRGGRPAKDC